LPVAAKKKWLLFSNSFIPKSNTWKEKLQSLINNSAQTWGHIPWAMLA
jgi:hypothetical protein